MTMENQGITLNFVDEARLVRNGQVYWNPSQSYPEGHFNASLRAFDAVRLLVRVRTSDEAPPERNRLPERVTVGEFPYYVGAAGAARAAPGLIRTARDWASREQFFVLRGPGFLSTLVAYWLRRARKPYAVEVLGDYREVFRVIKHPLRRVWRALYSTTGTQIVQHASAVLYVAKYLQAAYPSGPHTESIVASDVRLYPAAFSAPRIYPSTPRPLHIINVGNMEQVYKGHNYVMQAMAMCARQDIPIKAHFVGEGRLRPQYEQMAEELGLADAVRFHGSVLWGPDLFRILDEADLYVQSSLTEGLPKALVEAMARGLPAIGTRVGGIPELLTPDALVNAADAEGLAGKLMELGQSPARLTELSRVNFTKALEYRTEITEQKREEFYHAVRSRIADGTPFHSVNHIR